MRLEDEIREMMLKINRDIHPEDLRRLVLDNRQPGRKRHSLETFKRVMQRMDDIETVYNGGVFYRRLKKPPTITDIFFKQVENFIDDYRRG